MVLCERVNNKNKTNLLFCGTVHYVVQSRLRTQPFHSSLQGTFHGRDVCDPINSILMTWICPGSGQRARTFPAAMSEKKRLYSKAMLYNIFLNGWSCQRHFTNKKDSFLVLQERG